MAHDADRRMLLGAVATRMRHQGVPQPHFGHINSIHVNTHLPSRLHLLDAQIHRHFLSFATTTALGLESILLSSQETDVYDDQNDRVHLGLPAHRHEDAPLDAPAASLLCALAENLRRKQPVRVVRAVAERADSHAAGLRPPRQCDLEHHFRYDGVYEVHRAEPQQPFAFVLRRAPGQPSLPRAARRTEGAAAAAAVPTAADNPKAALRPLGLLAHGPLPSGRLPPCAEEVLAGVPEPSIDDALTCLRAARDELLSRLGPHGRFEHSRRALEAHVCSRRATELLHAPCDALRRVYPPAKFARWPAKAAAR